MSFAFLAIAVVVVVVALALATDATRPAGPTAPGAGPAIPTRATVVRVGGPWRGTRAIPAGFLGLSLEYSAVSAYAGRDPSAVDPVLSGLPGYLNLA